MSQWPAKLIKTIFFFICFCLLLRMIFKEVLRYRKNDDASSIAFKKFNESPQDKYPTFTLCFQGNRVDAKWRETIYNNKLLAASGNTPSKYWKMITGNKNATKEEIRNLPDFSSITIKLRSMIKEFSTIDDNNRAINEWRLRNNTFSSPSKSNPLIALTDSSEWPFYITYQSPDKVCFSRKVAFEQNVIKLYDRVTLASAMLDKLSGQGLVFLYVHYEGHMIRNFGKEVAFLSLTEKSGDINKTLRIKISAVNVIRRRSDAKTACNPNVDDQDTVFRNSVMKKSGCIPPYWRTMSNGSQLGLSLCSSSNQLEKAYVYTRNGSLRKELLSDDNTPCTEMTVSSSIEMKTDKKDLLLVFHYRSDNYMETTNTRAYHFESLWSSLGGLVGLFMGFSLLQLPGVLSTLWSLMINVITRKNKLQQLA